MGTVLHERIVIITGAGSGIGRATAELFYAEGASLVLADISGAEHAVASALGPRAVAKTTDVSRSADMKELLAFTIGTFGRIDVLCNVAGISGNLGFVANDTEENFDLLVNVNLRSVFLGMKYAIPVMLSSGGGSIVNISSMAGLLGTPGLGSYSASKGGVIQLSRTAAIEYAAQGVRVNVICPGVIDTPILAKPRELFPNAETRLIAGTPMGRIGRPDEIAAAILFFASSQSSYVTGAVLPVDGGMGAG